MQTQFGLQSIPKYSICTGKMARGFVWGNVYKLYFSKMQTK